MGLSWKEEEEVCREFGSLRGRIRKCLSGVGTACAETQGRTCKQFSKNGVEVFRVLRV